MYNVFIYEKVTMFSDRHKTIPILCANTYGYINYIN